MLIDTNVWSELLRRTPEPKVIAFLSAQCDGLYLSTIVAAEMEFGVANAATADRRAQIAEYVIDVRLRCAARVLAPGFAAARIWGELKARLARSGKPIADMDLMIAAQAIAAGMPLVTRNVSDMARTGATIIDPWGS